MGFLSSALKIGGIVAAPFTGGASLGLTGFADGLDGILDSGVTDIVGGIMSNNANASQARQANAFTERMSSTSYQRAVADLKAAGLNPMLAYTNGGAVGGAGAQAVMQNVASGSSANARAAKLNNAQILNLAEQNNQIKAATRQANSQAALNEANTAKALVEAANLKIDTGIKSNELSNSNVRRSIVKAIEPFVNNASSTVREGLKRPIEVRSLKSNPFKN